MSSPTPSSSAPDAAADQALLQEVRQTALLLAPCFAVVGLAAFVGRLLATLS